MKPVPHQATCVALGEPGARRAILIEGAPGSGKSSLALALIDRGAVLVGDDGILLRTDGTRLTASPPPNIGGLIEVRNVGLFEFPTAAAPVSLAITLDPQAPRLPEGASVVTRAGISIPAIALYPAGEALVLRTELALDRYGLR